MEGGYEMGSSSQGLVLLEGGGVCVRGARKLGVRGGEVKSGPSESSRFPLVWMAMLLTRRDTGGGADLGGEVI